MMNDVKKGSKPRVRAFKRSIQSLEEIFAFIAKCFSDWKIPSRVRGPIDLAVEELFINCVRHNHNSTRDIVIELALHGRELAVSLTDSNGGAFSLLKRPPVDVDAPIEERKPGGLGIHLVKKLADRIEEDHAVGKHKITFYKVLR